MANHLTKTVNNNPIQFNSIQSTQIDDNNKSKFAHLSLDCIAFIFFLCKKKKRNFVEIESNAHTQLHNFITQTVDRRSDKFEIRVQFI